MIPSLDSIFSRLRLRQLRLLIELDRCGSLHKAAEAMAISQPGATKALREVEEVLGVPLFQRLPSGLVANDNVWLEVAESAVVVAVASH